MSTPSEEMAGTQRNTQDVLRLQIEAGLTELERPASGQFLSALACGLNLTLGIFSVFIMATQAGPALGEFATQLLEAFVYTFGFVFAIIAQTELFTEHTSLALIPVLDGRSSLAKLGQLWTLVYIGNMVGSAVFAVLGFYAGLSLHLIDLHAFIGTAMTFINLSPMAVFLGALLAGWLMALLAWILTSVRDTISRITVIIIVTFLIGFGHLPHCVAANAEIIAGMMAGANISVIDLVRFEAVTTLGNIIGGAVFVGLLNYSHAVRGTDDLDVEV